MFCLDDELKFLKKLGYRLVETGKCRAITLDENYNPVQEIRDYKLIDKDGYNLNKEILVDDFSFCSWDCSGEYCGHIEEDAVKVKRAKSLHSKSFNLNEEWVAFLQEEYGDEYTQMLTEKYKTDIEGLKQRKTNFPNEKQKNLKLIQMLEEKLKFLGKAIEVPFEM